MTDTRECECEWPIHVWAITFDQDTFGIFRTEEAAQKDFEEQCNTGGPAWKDCKVIKLKVNV